MKNTSIKLDDRFNAFISNQIQEGHYKSASERQADNGQFVNYSSESLIAELDQESST